MEETQENTNKDTSEVKEEPISFGTFLQEYPIGTRQAVKAYFKFDGSATPSYQYQKCTPVLRLHCDTCEGIRNFEGEWQHYRYLESGTTPYDFLLYTCRDCKQGKKRYSLYVTPITDHGDGLALKMGEDPELNIKIPTNLRDLVGEDYPYFIKGLKCERHGLGIGAYSYYRRVVENQKDRMCSEILKVAKKLGAEKELTQNIENAINEVQFSKAIDTMKDALPESLLVDGHNPFKLLHKALSVGIHNQTDEKCLELAHHIRMVLTDLSERIKLALSEKRDLRSAVSSLLKFNQEKSS